jgi:hypothetical protein
VGSKRKRQPVGWWRFCEWEAFHDDYNVEFLPTAHRCWILVYRISHDSHSQTVPDRHYVLVFGRGFYQQQQQTHF